MARSQATRPARRRNSAAAIDRAVPRHAGGRARRGAQHARSLSRATSTTSPRYLADKRRDRSRRRRPTTCAPISATSRERGFKAVVGGAPAVGDPPALSLPLCRGPPPRRSGRRARGPEARPRRCRRCSSIARGRPADRGRARGAPTTRRADAERLRALRLACLLEVLYATGLRVSELVALPASAARRDERMLIVRGKGGKERLVPLNEAAKRAMRDYLGAARRGAARQRRSKWLFPSFGESGH